MVSNCTCTQEQRWRVKANNSIQRLPHVEHQLYMANEENSAAKVENRALLADIATKEAAIKDLQTRMLSVPLQVQNSYPSFTKTLFFFFSLFLLLAFFGYNIVRFVVVTPPAEFMM